MTQIYKDLYDNVDIGENWSIKESIELLNYWYEKQKDLFLIADINGIPVGAIMFGVKSWFDGLRLVDTKIFVAKEAQKKHISRQLLI